MQYHQKYEQKIKNNIRVLQSKSQELGSNTSFQAIFNFYKQKSRQLLHFLKLINIHDINLSQKQKAQLLSCFKILVAIIQSFQYLKYGQIFPYFAYFIKRFYFLFQKQKIKFQQDKTCIDKTLDNQQILLNKNIVKISQNEANFLNSVKINNFFLDLSNNQIILQNPQCICCSPVFLKRFNIFNKNQIVKVIIPITQQEVFDKFSLLRYLCGVCNQKGGVLLIGAQKNQDQLNGIGIRFKNNQQIINMEKIIFQQICNIKPKNIYLIERVLVHTNFLEEQKIGEEYMRLCIRVWIFPQTTAKISYVELQAKGHKIYQVYILNSEKQLLRILPNTSQTLQNIYQIMHKKYKQKKINKHSHSNILCYRPYSNYSKNYQQYIKNLSQKQFYQQCQNYQTQLVKNFPKQMQKITQIADQIKIKFKNASLLIVGSKKDLREIEEFQRCLNFMKICHQLNEPYSNYFKSTRIIRVISHELSFYQLKQTMNICHKKQYVKSNYIKMMPVYNCVGVQRSKINDVDFRFIKDKFQVRYKTNYQVSYYSSVTKIGQVKEMAGFVVQNYDQAIFTYMILQQLKFRPYFVKPNHKNEDYFVQD